MRVPVSPAANPRAAQTRPFGWAAHMMGGEVTLTQGWKLGSPVHTKDYNKCSAHYLLQYCVSSHSCLYLPAINDDRRMMFTSTVRTACGTYYWCYSEWIKDSLYPTGISCTVSTVYLCTCAIHSSVYTRCWTSSLGAVALPCWGSLWGPYVMTSAHHCLPQIPTFHTFLACMCLHSVVGADPPPASPRDADSQTLRSSLTRVYAEPANLRPSIFYLRAVARLQKEDTTAH